VYFAVEDCDASVARATELGAKVCCPPTEIEHVGRFAALLDPQGAGFSVIQLAPPPA
jgi:predicted enzyme related to lactoylglutathione lyase